MASGLLQPRRLKLPVLQFHVATVDIIIHYLAAEAIIGFEAYTLLSWPTLHKNTLVHAMLSLMTPETASMALP